MKKRTLGSGGVSLTTRPTPKLLAKIKAHWKKQTKDYGYAFFGYADLVAEIDALNAELTGFYRMAKKGVWVKEKEYCEMVDKIAQAKNSNLAASEAARCAMRNVLCLVRDAEKQGNDGSLYYRWSVRAIEADSATPNAVMEIVSRIAEYGYPSRLGSIKELAEVVDEWVTALRAALGMKNE